MVIYSVSSRSSPLFVNLPLAVCYPLCLLFLAFANLSYTLGHAGVATGGELQRVPLESPEEGEQDEMAMAPASPREEVNYTLPAMGTLSPPMPRHSMHTLHCDKACSRVIGTCGNAYSGQ